MRALALETWAYVARAGTTIDSVAVSRTAKPDADPTTNWTPLGIVLGHQITDNSATEKILRGNPGQVKVWDMLKLTSDITHELTMGELSRLGIELLFRAGAAVTTTYTPGAQTEIPKFWLKIQQYDQADQLVNAFDVFVALQATNPSIAQATRVGWTLQAQELISSLNTGSLSNLAAS